MSSSVKCVNIESKSPAIYLDHLELRLPFPAHSGERHRRVPIDPSLGLYLHNPHIFISKRGQGSIGGISCGMTNGRKIYFATQGKPLPVDINHMRIGSKLDNQLADDEKSHLTELCGSESPWMWQLSSFVKAIESIRSEAISRHGVLPFGYDATCPKAEFYCEIPLCHDPMITEQQITSSVSKHFGSPTQKTDHRKGFRCTEWHLPSVKVGDSTVSARLKSYRKGKMQRIEVVYNDVCIRHDPTEANLDSVIQSLATYGYLATDTLQRISSEIFQPISQIDPGKLRQAICDRVSNGENKKSVDQLVLAIMEYGVYSRSRTERRVRMSYGDLKTLSDPITGILNERHELGATGLAGKRLVYQLKDNWESVPARPQAVPDGDSVERGNNKSTETTDHCADQPPLLNLAVFLKGTDTSLNEELDRIWNDDSANAIIFVYPKQFVGATIRGRKLPLAS